MKQNKNQPQTSTPPVVAVLGHVDHGKTTLLDTIRKTNIAGREHGGITQKIGASRIEIMHDEKKRSITFIDTPGHAAFSQMRGRGVQAADIGLLVVSSIDGVMPQTKEAIQLLKDTPFIVVFTKADLPDKNLEKVKQQLLRENVMLEGLGGDVPMIEVSAKTGKNMKELLDLILLVFEMQYVQGERKLGVSTEAFKGVIIESKLDPKVGARATVIIKQGTIKLKDVIVTDSVDVRVRALMTDEGQVKEASVGYGVEVLGFVKVPAVGSIVYKKDEVELTSSPVSLLKPQQSLVEQHIALEKKPQFALTELPKDTLYLILCADTEGSLEAIKEAIPKDVRLIMAKTGEISEADILLAKSTKAIVLTFNIKIRPDIAKFAFTEKILLKNYTIIYEMLDEIKEVLENKKLAQVEQIFGSATILASFPFEKTQVLGVRILDGRLVKGDKVRLIRNDEAVGESMISSLRQGKNSTSKVEKGHEAGVILSPFLDFHIGDMLISHS